MVGLEEIWATELQILDKIDEFCNTNHLKYSLAFGTLIGAVRHKGFIPWDDDIDIIMPRNDYEYLVKNWNVEGYIIQNKATNNDFTQNFTKIRKDNTTFIQSEFEKNVSYHTGLFVDIFPGDRVANNRFFRKVQFFECAIILLFSREFASRDANIIVQNILLSLPRDMRLRILKFLERRVQRWNNKKTEFFFPSTIKEAKVYYPSDIFDEMTTIEFAGKKYNCVKDYDTVLTALYGDYMKLPPIEERNLQHHPLLVDLNNNYQVLK